MTTYGIWFIHKGYTTMFWPLSGDDDNWLSMFHTWRIYNHALTVVMKWWQLTEHDSYLRDMSPCSVRCHGTMTTEVECFIHEWYITMLWRCHEKMTTDGACFIHEWYITMLLPLSSDDFNSRGSMLCPLSWDDDNWRSMFYTYMHEWYITMFWQLSWDDDNWWRSMLCPLSWDDDNWRNMFYTWMI